jgi:hypothetical protein
LGPAQNVSAFKTFLLFSLDYYAILIEIGKGEKIMVKLLLKKINLLMLAIGLWTIKNHHTITLLVEFLAD